MGRIGRNRCRFQSWLDPVWARNWTLIALEYRFAKRLIFKSAIGVVASDRDDGIEGHPLSDAHLPITFFHWLVLQRCLENNFATELQSIFKMLGKPRSGSEAIPTNLLGGFWISAVKPDFHFDTRSCRGTRLAITLIAILFRSFAGFSVVALVLVSRFLLAFAFAARYEITPVVVENSTLLTAIEAVLQLLCHFTLLWSGC
jgi:hypothetical protein